MLAIQKSKSHKGKCTPNVLPCRIQHNGPVSASKRYWDPRRAADGKTTSYFRGRKLYAKTLKVPKGYSGAILVSTDRVLKESKEEEEEEEGDEGEMKAVKVVEEQSDFDEVMVWGHEVVLDGGDPYIRGMEEWIGFAEAIHGNDEDGGVEEEKS